MIMRKPPRPIPSRAVDAAVPISCAVVGAILSTAAAAAFRRGSAAEHAEVRARRRAIDAGFADGWLSVRPLCPADARAIASWTADAETRLFFSSDVAWDTARVKRWIRSLGRQRRHISLAILISEEIVGVGQVFSLKPGVAELALLVSPGHRGRHVGVAWVDPVVACLFASGSHRVQAHVREGNDRSIGLLSRCGFAREGEARNWQGRNGHRLTYARVPDEHKLDGGASSTPLATTD
jgi:RimJ/RimL family protein N-acetyltransferase